MTRYQFDKRLRELRKEKGLSQEKLASMIRMDVTTVCRWELGERFPTLDRVYDVAKALDVSVHDLIIEDSE